MCNVDKNIRIQNGTDNTNGAGLKNSSKLQEKKEYDPIIDGTIKLPCIRMFGISHYRYKDCNPADLVALNKVIVHKDCAEAFKQMQAAAKKEGLNLKIVSGYRSSKYQIEVFKRKFGGKYPTDEQMKARLKYSAPSGFSEHHTGLAIDINETETIFKDTKEYKWLCEHAKEYGFELSFPENNSQGLGFEPWHW